MFTHKLDGDLLFARVYELDLECPQCGECFYLNSVGRNWSQVPGRRTKKGFDAGPYNFRTGRFSFPSCHSTFAVGLYLFPVEDKDGQLARHSEEPAVDWVPTYRQGLALRAQTTARVALRAQGWKDARNTVVRDGCCCRIQAQKVSESSRDGRGQQTWGFGGRPAKKPYRTRFLINPECPIHGGLVDKEIGEKTPAGVARSVPAGTEMVEMKEPIQATSRSDDGDRGD